MRLPARVDNVLRGPDGGFWLVLTDPRPASKGDLMTTELSATQIGIRAPRVSFIWLEITGKCGLECIHCYAQSGPSGSHGVMTANQWHDVIDQAAALGVETVQFIGGEPTLHPAFPDLLGHAADIGLNVEIYSNLTHVKEKWWDRLAHPRVSLATSYYSDLATEHDDITGRTGSHARTRANITEALRRGIPVRVGIVATSNRQRVEQARAELQALGVTNIGVDHMRQVGRGARTQEPDASQLCGQCGHGNLAISPDGRVWPCVFARWFDIGNVRTARLADIVASPAMAAALANLDAAFRRDWPCVPKMCDPQCGPRCSPTCDPINCEPICAPQYTKDPCPPTRECHPNKCRPTSTRS